MFVRLLFIMILFGTSLLAHSYSVDGLKIDEPKLLNIVKQRLPDYGVLRKTNDNLVYLAISNDYSKLLSKQIKLDNFVDLASDGTLGAHILVIDKDELEVDDSLSKLTELGSRIKFDLLGFYSVVADNTEYLMLAVDSPELAAIRQKYNLLPDIDGHSFHITIGSRVLTDEDELDDLG